MFGIGEHGRPRRRDEPANGNLLEVLLDSIDVAVVACGVDGQPTHLNRRALELMRMDPANGDPDTWVEQVLPRTPDGREMSLAELPIVRALHGEEVRDVDIIVRTPRGDILMCTTATPVSDGEGRRLGAVAVFAEVTEQRARESRIREELRTLNLANGVQEALDVGRLLLYEQPIIDLASGETVLSELLLRLRGADATIEGPAELLAAAERHGMITVIDEWVFEQATKIASTGRAVTVNISAQTVVRSSFVDFAEDALKRNDAAPSMITFEITETAVVSDMIGASRFAERLEATGAHFALDDFGTGYAALTYLKHLPFSYLKIDVDFVRDLLHNERSRAVVAGVVALGRGFGMRTIAEGAEDQATLDLLRELGVDLAQGFHIGRPTPVPDVSRALRRPALGGTTRASGAARRFPAPDSASPRVSTTRR